MLHYSKKLKTSCSQKRKKTVTIEYKTDTVSNGSLMPLKHVQSIVSKTSVAELAHYKNEYISQHAFSSAVLCICTLHMAPIYILYHQ